MSSATQRRWRSAMRWIALTVLGPLLLSVLVVGLLRWIDPPTSAFMLGQALAARFDARAPSRIHHEWVEWPTIADSIKLAVLAAEDQRFLDHRGFDLIEIRQALRALRAGERARGASTITQQTAKNLFLWSGRDPLRKGLEAWLTLLIETLWPKQRILEIYLNIAQFSPDTFGIGAASWRFFDRPAGTLTDRQAARLAAVLPNPSRYRIDAPSPYVQRRVVWIQRQMTQLGGSAYLRTLSTGASPSQSD